MVNFLKQNKKSLGTLRMPVEAALRSQNLSLALGLLWLGAFALTANTQNSLWDLQRLIPGSAWALAGYLNLGMLRELAFKVMVGGGLILQNRSRLVLLLALAIVLVFKLLRRAAAGADPAALQPGTARTATPAQAGPRSPLHTPGFSFNLWRRLPSPELCSSLSTA